MDDAERRRANAFGLANIAEAHRREAPGYDTTARAGPDYVDGALRVQTAMHHLDEALPSGQRERTRAAFLLLESGVAELRQWLVLRGVV